MSVVPDRIFYDKNTKDAWKEILYCAWECEVQSEEHRDRLVKAYGLTNDIYSEDFGDGKRDYILRFEQDRQLDGREKHFLRAIERMPLPKHEADDLLPYCECNYCTSVVECLSSLSTFTAGCVQSGAPLSQHVWNARRRKASGVPLPKQSWCNVL